MALWSLTQERVEKLRRQIGDVEIEMDTLIKLSKEDLWTQDLDAFLEQWHIDLDEEHKRKRKATSRGRRTSKMVKVGGAGPMVKKRKGQANYESDDDFEAERPKKKIAPKKKEIVVPKKQTLLPSIFSQASSNKDAPITLDGHSSEIDVDADKIVSKAATKTTKAAEPKKVKAKAPIKAASQTVSGDSDDEVLSKKPARKARAAASKPIRYGGDSDSDDSNGDDFLGDITNMVKGLPKADTTSAESKSLFTASRGKSNSAITLNPNQASASKSYTEISDGDETNFMALVPPQSPRKSINVTKNANLTDEDDEDDDVVAFTTNKARPAAAAKPAPSKPSKVSKPQASSNNDSDSDIFMAVAKQSSKPAPKKAPAAQFKKDAAAAPKPKTTKATAPKPPTLSPAAKAYAAKQARNATHDSDDMFDAPSSSDVEAAAGPAQARNGATDLDAMADDLLSSPVQSVLAKGGMKGGKAVVGKAVKPAAGKAAASKTAASKVKPAAAKASKVAAPAKPGRAAGKAKKVIDSDGDLSMDDDVVAIDDESDEAVEAKPAAKRPARRAVAEKKKPVYALDSEEDEENESESEGESFGDDESD